MKEAYVTYEVAKLLKEKGFDWDTDKVYERNLMVCRYEDYPMPTQQMACSWLREEHKIHITTEPLEMFKEERIVYEPTIYLLNDFDDFALEYETVHLKECDTNEDAVEAALEYVLKNLI